MDEWMKCYGDGGGGGIIFVWNIKDIDNEA